MDDFREYYTRLRNGTYGCVNRIVMNAHYDVAQTAGGLQTWWNRFRDHHDLIKNHLTRLAACFGRRTAAGARATP